jgi:ferrous iron transport protein B
MNVPLVLAFNMSDIVKQKGLLFDIEQLSTLLEAVIVPTVGNRGRGTIELLDAIVETARQDKGERIHRINYGKEIEKELAGIKAILGDK